jgi:quercetin dioxygenase-like cupin family protein
MKLKRRRVVTGHDSNGKAIVKIDDIAPNVISNRPGAESVVVWSTRGFPVNNDDPADDPTAEKIGTTIDNGTVFRVVRYEPGVSPRNHRTDSIDYAVVLTGQIDMDLDGTVVRLQAGDLVVQRGTIHNWSNPGPDVCEIAFVLVSGKPVTAGGKVLDAHG